MSKANLKIEYVKTEDLQTYENNAKEHPAEQVEQIKLSIAQFGFNDPIAVWKDNVIIEGHGRLIAAMELGMDEVPIIRLDSLTDEQRRAYMLVHNKLTMNSDFNIDLLAMELEDITDINMVDFGFDLKLDELENELIDNTKEIDYKEKMSVVIDCETEEEAEIVFNKLSEEGYTCRISTL